jgi:mRNA-degrading endonuclease RelE of RelBE toxin-antitoxin system
MFRVQYTPEALRELKRLRQFDATRILDAIEKHLRIDPIAEGGMLKRIVLASGEPIRQLRVADFRVFYDADEAERVVFVRHVRRKGSKTTGEIL